jgi:hypothetical protein
MLCRSLFALLFLIPLVILLFVLLRNTAYDYSFCILIAFLLWRGFCIRLFDHRNMTLSPFGKISGHLNKGYPMGCRPFVLYLYNADFIHRLLKEKRKEEKMYWTLYEWSMSNPCNLPHFIRIRHPKWRPRDRANSRWLKLKNIK